jgi:hypothetical protein
MSTPGPPQNPDAKRTSDSGLERLGERGRAGGHCAGASSGPTCSPAGTTTYPPVSWHDVRRPFLPPGRRRAGQAPAHRRAGCRHPGGRALPPRATAHTFTPGAHVDGPRVRADARSANLAHRARPVVRAIVTTHRGHRCPARRSPQIARAADPRAPRADRKIELGDDPTRHKREGTESLFHMTATNPDRRLTVGTPRPVEREVDADVTDPNRGRASRADPCAAFPSNPISVHAR